MNFLALNYRGKGFAVEDDFQTKQGEASVFWAIKGLTNQPTEELVPRAFQIAEIQHGERLTFDVWCSSTAPSSKINMFFEWVGVGGWKRKLEAM